MVQCNYKLLEGDAGMMKRIVSLIALTIMIPFQVLAVNVTTNCNNVPIQESNTSPRVIDTLGNGTTIEKLGASGEFYKVRYNGVEGWLNRAYTVEGEVEKKAGGLEIHFIDPNSRVDAIYIKSGDKSMFIDGGFHKDATAEINYLKKLGVTKIDYYLGTHSHSNHVGAAGPIISAFGIKTVYYGRQTYDKTSSTLYMMNEKASSAEKQAIAACKKIVLNVGDVIEMNDLKITCVGPIKIVSAKPSATKENNNSLILRMEYGKKTFLLAGDTSSSQLNDANSNNPGCIDVEFYKNSHHNSSLSTATYNLISPSYVFFTTQSSYLPKSSYLKTIANSGAKYYIVTTNRDRSVLVKTDGENIEIKTKYNL